MASTCLTGPRFEPEKLKKEWEGLSQDDRDLASSDVCGGSRRILTNEESSSIVVNERLDSLQEEIDKIPNKEAYETAQLICPDYVNSYKFRMAFLRADCFNVKSASKRFVRYWDDKVALFGTDRAFKKLSIDILDDDEMRILKMGGAYLLPEKDDAGRRLILTLRSRIDHKHSNMKKQLRVLWYLIHAAVENDVGVQKNGMVHIASDVRLRGVFENVNNKLDRLIVKAILHALPVRFVGIHCIVRRSLLMNLLLPNYLALIGPFLRARYREYDGNLVHKYLDAFTCYLRILVVLYGQIMILLNGFEIMMTNRDHQRKKKK